MDYNRHTAVPGPLFTENVMVILKIEAYYMCIGGIEVHADMGTGLQDGFFGPELFSEYDYLS